MVQIVERKSIPGSGGFTLIDVMITLLVMTVALIGTMTAFPTIMKSILVNKARSLATTMAQEQLEVYKNTPYYKLQVTTPTIEDTRFPSGQVNYDNRYYPPTKIITGGIEYEVLTYVEKVTDSGGGNFIHVDWAAPDVGMKRVYVHVVFRSEGGAGDWKKVTLSSLIENTDRQPLNATIAGATQSTSSVKIPNANIYVLENPAFNTTSDAFGNYSFSVPAGSWTLVTNATGYFTKVSTPVVASSGATTTANISLTKRFLANVTGYVYIQDHLVITQVVADYTNTVAPIQSNQEWVELYNPTTYNILIASQSVAGGIYDIFFVTVSWIHPSNDEPGGGGASRFLLAHPSANDSKFTAFRATSSVWDTRFSSTSLIYIPPQRFFLLANYSTITVTIGGVNLSRIADAYYEGGDGGDVINSASGIRVTGNGGYSYNGRTDWHDGLSWGNSGANKAVEGTVNTNSLGSGNILHRLAYKFSSNDCYTTQTDTFRDTNFIANAFDSNSNGAVCPGTSDFDLGFIGGDYYNTYSSGVLCNVDISMPPYTGTPAVGAIVTSNDGLSGTAFVQTYGSFTLTDVTTGAWTIAIVSATPQKTYYQEIYSTVTTATPYWGIPNSLSSPQWNLNVNFSSLSLTTDKGIIAGRVTGITGQGISGITIDALSQQAQTNSQGYYRILLTSGTYTVQCNITNPNFSYTQASSASVVVQLGQITDGVNFTLVSGGNLRGFITSNGVDPMPGYAVSLQKDGAEYKTGISGTDGYFLLTNVATVPLTSPYTLYCITDSGESVSPSDGIVATPIAGQTIHVGTFTITAGFATFSGEVKLGSDKIRTGVLLVASTQPIVTTSSGPTINSTLVSGTTTYYFAASDAQGNYQLKVLGGTRYYLYGWYKNDAGILVRQSSAPTATIAIGETKTINLQW